MGVFNLLPIPPLDGGQVWARALERWPWGRKVALGATLLGLGFLVALFALTLLYDFGLMGRG
ncbi:MAG: site-2 protease family protein [Meiothermus sp.]|nr:site-2 protease family protein [Meiothermus sp.]MDW8482281.1 site-2 protease family protein [Meiothermus sp.]